MTMTVQPRHIKLLLAGHEQNWPYAKYELHELQEAFERAVQGLAELQGLPMGGMVDAIAKGPMDELAKAIDAKDEVAFDAALRKTHPRLQRLPPGRQRRNGGDQGAKRIELPRPGFPAGQAVNAGQRLFFGGCRACFRPLR